MLDATQVTYPFIAPPDLLPPNISNLTPIVIERTMGPRSLLPNNTRITHAKHFLHTQLLNLNTLKTPMLCNPFHASAVKPTSSTRMKTKKLPLSGQPRIINNTKAYFLINFSVFKSTLLWLDTLIRYIPLTRLLTSTVFTFF